MFDLHICRTTYTRRPKEDGDRRHEGQPDVALSTPVRC